MRPSIFSVRDHCPDRSRSLSQPYTDVIAQACHAEVPGYDTLWVAEHHFHEYGVVPNPAVFPSHLAAQTQWLRLGTAISILIFHHPAMVAENYAMVDTLPGGWLSLGVGSDYPKHEFRGYDADPVTKRERFDKVLMLAERLPAGERVHHADQFHTLHDARFNILPVQACVPIYVAILRRKAVYHIGRQGRRMPFVPYASAESSENIRTLMDEYRRGLAEAGIVDARGMAAIVLHMHAGLAEAVVRATAVDAFGLYAAMWLYARRQTYDGVLASGLSLFGTSDAVAEKLAQLPDMGVDYVMALYDFGSMLQSVVLESMYALVEDALLYAGITALAA